MAWSAEDKMITKGEEITTGLFSPTSNPPW